MKVLNIKKRRIQKICIAAFCAAFLHNAYAETTSPKNPDKANLLTKAAKPTHTSVESLITEEPPKKYIGQSKYSFVGPPRFDELQNQNTVQVAMIDKRATTDVPQYIYQPRVEFPNANIDHYSLFDADKARGSWVLIDTSKETISVMRDNKPKLILHNISIGRNGITTNKTINDERTPVGKFKINRINNNSQYKLFFGINYPTSSYAKQAYLDEKIDTDTYFAILKALKNNQTPPQTTDLGGYLGIHGLGKADLKIHKQLNWTKGCVAITNKQITKLRKYINIGTIVVIK